MSKSKRARFHVRAKETILKRGMVDYSMTGQYKTFVPGDAFLTDERFYFEAKLDSGELFSFEIPLVQIYDVRMVGVPLFTRSMLQYQIEQRRSNSFCRACFFAESML